MSKLTLNNSVMMTCTVDLLTRARELSLDWNKTGVICSLIGNLRYVDEVEDRHQFYCTLVLDTSNPTTAARRIEATLAKIERILMRYRKAS